jgi:hypothetical protein
MNGWWSSSQRRVRCWLVVLVLVLVLVLAFTSFFPLFVTDAFVPPTTTPATAIARQQNNCASTDLSIASIHHHTQRKRELASTSCCKSKVLSRPVQVHCGLYSTCDMDTLISHTLMSLFYFIPHSSPTELKGQRRQYRHRFGVGAALPTRRCKW